MLTTWDSHDSEVSINGGTVVPLSHPCLDGFSLLHLHLGVPPCMETLIWKDGDLTNVCSADLPWFSRHFERDNDDYKTNGFGVYLMFGQTWRFHFLALYLTQITLGVDHRS